MQKRKKNKCICGRRLPCPILDIWYYIRKDKQRRYKERRWELAGW